MPSRLTLCARGVGATVVAATLASGLAAPAPSQGPPIFGETIEVRVVNVEVVVTDRSGARVAGLPAEAFRLLVDGREVPIGYFSEVSAGLLTTGEEEPSSTALPPAAVAAAGEAAPRRLLVFIDDLFSIAAQRNRVLAALADQLDLLGPEDSVAVVAFDGRRLELLADWGDSREAVRQALAEAARRKAGGVFRRVERRMLGPGPGGGGDDELERGAAARSVAALEAEQVDRVTAAAAAAMRAVGGPPGRRALLLLSGGWSYGLMPPSTVLELPATDTSDRLRFSLEARSLYRRLVDTANLLGFTIYPVDVPGIGGGGAIEDDPEGVDAPPAARFEADGGDSTLLFLARETGGRAALNSANIRALERAVADTGSYYWLGFTVGRRADGLRHRVRVEVDRPGLSTRSRRDFVDLTRQGEARMLVEASLFVPQRRGEGELTIAIGEIERRRGRQLEVPLTIRIPSDRLTFLPVDGAWMAAIEVTLGVMDRADAVSDLQTVPATLRLERPPAEGATATYALSVSLRRQRHDLAVAVLDLPSGVLLTGSAVVDP